MDNRQLRETCVEFVPAPRLRRPFFQMCEGDRCCRVLFSIPDWMARLFTPASPPSPTRDSGWLSSLYSSLCCLGLFGGSGLFDPGTQPPEWAKCDIPNTLAAIAKFQPCAKRHSFLDNPVSRGRRAQATRSPGFRPAKKASRLSSARKPMASRVSVVALPI